MQVILGGLLLLSAILNLIMGTGFLVNPISAGADFGLATTSLHGSSTLRGDMTAFFYVSAVFIALGAWRRRGAVLVPALALYSVALTGRAINLVLDGTYDGWFVPMSVEALTVALLIVAIRSWGLAQAPD
jgi:hypothetical protein